MDNNEKSLKTLSEKPIGWLNWSEDPGCLLLKIYGFGEEFTSCLYFKIPLSSLNRFFDGRLRGCPVFEELSEGDPSQ
jgi:hypothetical protein